MHWLLGRDKPTMAKNESQKEKWSKGDIDEGARGSFVIRTRQTNAMFDRKINVYH